MLYFHVLKKSPKVILILAFLANMLGPLPAKADELVLPTPGVMVSLSPEFTPCHLKGITIHPDNALKFDFIIHKGDSNLSEGQKQEEYKKLIKYFLASLAVPDENQWVNLSPYEKDRIIKEDFGKTEMGRDLLSQDYLLKQITASLIYPEQGLGQKFWDKVYEQAFKQYGNTNIPVNTFNKVWIVPDDAVIYEKGNTAYVLKNHLKVMLEQDYLALEHQGRVLSSVTPIVLVPVCAGGPPPQPPAPREDINALGSQVVREVILPALEKEVNEGKNFAMLRQVYSGMILAAWYKRVLKESLLGKIYADKAKIKGIDQDPKNNQAIYQRYLQAFKKGVYNYIKEDTDKYTHQTIPRKYFSGGTKGFARINIERTGAVDPAQAAAIQDDVAKMDMAAVALEEPKADAAMFSKDVTDQIIGLNIRFHVEAPTPSTDVPALSQSTDTTTALVKSVPPDIEALAKRQGLEDMLVPAPAGKTVEAKGLDQVLKAIDQHRKRDHTEADQVYLMAGLTPTETQDLTTILQGRRDRDRGSENVLVELPVSSLPVLQRQYGILKTALSRPTQPRKNPRINIAVDEDFFDAKTAEARIQAEKAKEPGPKDEINQEIKERGASAVIIQHTEAETAEMTPVEIANDQLKLAAGVYEKQGLLLFGKRKPMTVYGDYKSIIINIQRGFLGR